MLSFVGASCHWIQPMSTIANPGTLYHHKCTVPCVSSLQQTSLIGPLHLSQAHCRPSLEASQHLLQEQPWAGRASLPVPSMHLSASGGQQKGLLLKDSSAETMAFNKCSYFVTLRATTRWRKQEGAAGCSALAGSQCLCHTQTRSLIGLRCFVPMACMSVGVLSCSWPATCATT